MKKIYLTLFVTFLSLYTFPQSGLSNPDFSIVFSGVFQDEVIGLKLNNKSIFDGYKFNNIDSILRGNLSINQKESFIEIIFNSQVIQKRKIKINSFLDIKVSINNKVEAVLLDLRKGKIIVIDYNSSIKEKPVSIEQIQEPLILL